MGQLTHAANSQQGPNGLLRDSDGIRPKARSKRKVKRKTKTGITVVVPRSSVCVSFGSSSWQMPRVAKRSTGAHGSSAGSISRHSSAKRAQVGIVAREAVAFKEWWLESRATYLQPRRESLPSAKQRMEALRLRIVARGQAT